MANVIEITGKTVEEAIQAATAQLGVEASDLDVEVLELPKKKLFGLFGETPAMRPKLSTRPQKNSSPFWSRHPSRRLNRSTASKRLTRRENFCRTFSRQWNLKSRSKSRTRRTIAELSCSEKIWAC